MRVPELLEQAVPMRPAVVEIWSLERWEEEQRKIMEHAMKKDELEMMQDLQGGSAE